MGRRACHQCHQRIVGFARDDKAEEARSAGATEVGAEDLVEKVQGGWVDFDIAVATPDMMSVVGKLGKILGPRGLMPNPKVGTVTMDISQAIQDLKGGKVEYRVDKAGNVHVPVGKASFDSSQLVGNVKTLLESLMKAKPSSAKGTYVKTITVSTSMGPGIRIDPSAAVE